LKFQHRYFCSSDSKVDISVAEIGHGFKDAPVTFLSVVAAVSVGMFAVGKDGVDDVADDNWIVQHLAYGSTGIFMSMFMSATCSVPAAICIRLLWSRAAYTAIAQDMFSLATCFGSTSFFVGTAYRRLCGFWNRHVGALEAGASLISTQVTTFVKEDFIREFLKGATGACGSLAVLTVALRNPHLKRHLPVVSIPILGLSCFLFSGKNKTKS